MVPTTTELRGALGYSVYQLVSLTRIGPILNTHVRPDGLGVSRLRYGVQCPALVHSARPVVLCPVPEKKGVCPLCHVYHDRPSGLDRS